MRLPSDGLNIISFTFLDVKTDTGILSTDERRSSGFITNEDNDDELHTLTLAKEKMMKTEIRNFYY